MKKFLSIFLILFSSVVAFSQTNFDPKSLLTAPTGKPQLVNDFSNVLTADQKQALENKLDVFDDSTSTQIAVVIIPTLGENDPADYSVELGKAWGVGGKQFNNGVVLLVCTDPNNHQLFIATGYGVEGALPDVTCKEIIDDIITPAFKGSDYYGGLNEGTDAIIQATKGQYKAPEGYHKKGDVSFGKIFFYIILIFIVLSLIAGGGGSGGTFSRNGFFFPFLLGNMLGSGSGGWSGGGGSSGGGGGFGGFGGGGFGGGGAGGSW